MVYLDFWLQLNLAMEIVPPAQMTVAVLLAMTIERATFLPQPWEKISEGWTIFATIAELWSRLDPLSQRTCTFCPHGPRQHIAGRASRGFGALRLMPALRSDAYEGAHAFYAPRRYPNLEWRGAGLSLFLKFGLEDIQANG